MMIIYPPPKKEIYQVKKYEWVLFDADDTLFHFDAFRGLQVMFSRLGVEFLQQDYEEYEAVNQPLWVDYQNGVITSQQLQHQRFVSWANKLKKLPQELNSAFLMAMAEICVPLDGALSLLQTLKGKAKLGIITNGFAEMQQTRLEHAGMREFFDVLVVSELVGCAKPQAGIFEYALAAMGHPARDCVLMVGDNPASDILGGMHAGMETCWLNVKNKIVPEGVTPHYQVASLLELERLLKEAYCLVTA